jgi:hypothetical protein
MTETQSQESNGRSAAVRPRPDDPAGPPVQQTLDGAVAAAGAVQEIVRTGQAATAGVLQEWVDGVAGLPFTFLGRGDVGPVLSGRIWVDGAFELVDVWWNVHRRSVEEFLALQRRATAQMVDSGWALATVNRALLHRSGPATAPTAAPAPR